MWVLRLTRFGWRSYVAVVAALAGIDGAFLGGVAAVITAIGSMILGFLAYSKGQQAAAKGIAGVGPVEVSVAEQWRAIAASEQRRADRAERRAERLERQLADRSV